MKINKQVTSLELSRKLKELGVKQESFWYWKSRSYLGVVRSILVEGIPELKDRAGFFSAFTVAELGEMLPDNLVSSGMNDGKWFCVYGPRENGDDMPDSIWEDKEKYEFGYMTIGDKTEANARAKMLCYLIENNLLKKGDKK